MPGQAEIQRPQTIRGHECAEFIGGFSVVVVFFFFLVQSNGSTKCAQLLQKVNYVS